MQISPRTKTILLYLRICLSCGIIIYLSRLVDLERITLMLPMMQIQYVWFAIFLIFLTTLVVSMRWSLLLSHFKIKQTILDSWRYYLVGGFYGIVLPGMIGEDVVRLGLSSRRHAKSKVLIASSIFFERACGILVLMLLASIGAIIVPVLLEGNQQLVHLIIGIALGSIFLFAFCLFLIKIFRLSSLKNSQYVSHWKTQAMTMLGYIRNLPLRTLFVFFLLSIIAQFLDIVGCFLLSRAVHIHQPLSIFILIMPLAYVMTILPISIGGLGVREGVLTYFLVKVGVVVSDAVLLSLMIYLSRVLVGVIGGVLQFTSKRASVAKK